jgi:protein-arginine kinase activator protein McsA
MICDICKNEAPEYLKIQNIQKKQFFQICEKCYSQKYIELINGIRKAGPMINLMLKPADKELLKQLIIKLKP